MKMKLLMEAWKKHVTEAYGGDMNIHNAVSAIRRFVEDSNPLTDEAYLNLMQQGYMGGGVHQSLTDIIHHLRSHGEDEELAAKIESDMEALKTYIGTDQLDPNIEAFKDLINNVNDYIGEKFPSDIVN